MSVGTQVLMVAVCVANMLSLTSCAASSAIHEDVPRTRSEFVSNLRFGDTKLDKLLVVMRTSGGVDCWPVPRTQQEGDGYFGSAAVVKIRVTAKRNNIAVPGPVVDDPSRSSVWNGDQVLHFLTPQDSLLEAESNGLYLVHELEAGEPLDFYWGISRSEFLRIPGRDLRVPAENVPYNRALYRLTNSAIHPNSPSRGGADPAKILVWHTFVVNYTETGRDLFTPAEEMNTSKFTRQAIDEYVVQLRVSVAGPDIDMKGSFGPSRPMGVPLAAILPYSGRCEVSIAVVEDIEPDETLGE